MKQKIKITPGEARIIQSWISNLDMPIDLYIAEKAAICAVLELLPKLFRIECDGIENKKKTLTMSYAQFFGLLFLFETQPICEWMAPALNAIYDELYRIEIATKIKLTIRKTRGGITAML